MWALQGWNLDPLLWEQGVLAAGPPGKSLKYLLVHVIPSLQLVLKAVTGSLDIYSFSVLIY